MPNSIIDYQLNAQNLTPTVRAMLEQQMQLLREKLPELPPLVVNDLVFTVATEWEQMTQLTLDNLVQSQSPLFKLLHLKLIFQLFTERALVNLDPLARENALSQVREVYNQ